ncbi:MAG: phenylalanine--tRNA ligase subunit alpha [Candidatus Bathyarchaeia archaeon]
MAHRSSYLQVGWRLIRSMAEMRDLEFEVLKALAESSGQGSVEEVCKRSGLNHSAVMRSILALEKDNLVEVTEQPVSFFKLTDEGRTDIAKGLPERRLAKATIELGGSATLAAAAERAGLSSEEASIALGWLIKKGLCSLERKGDTVVIKVTESPPVSMEESLLRLVEERMQIASTELNSEQIETARALRRRKLLEEKPAVLRMTKLTEAGWARVKEGASSGIEITALTSELLTSGRWREVKLREYDVKAPPPPLYPGRKHFYLEFLEEVRLLLVSMGFEEAEGPYVETEFWNFDVLFQAQDHPAREIHDSYLIEEPTRGSLPDDTLVDRVRRVHENGWNTGSRGWRYKWSRDVASRLILRTQTTAVSARYLYQHKDPPVKMFCISKVYRPDVLDAKHSMEFSQCEGIVMDKGLNFRHLIGFLREFAEALELGEVIFRPGYFPFTEPSVESFVKHPILGWVEFVGAGMFRPEVLSPLGIKHPVLAWGIGIDRLAMAKLGISDIRELYSKRLDLLRMR